MSNIFSTDDLKILKNINTAYEDAHNGTTAFTQSKVFKNSGIEMSNSTPNGIKTYANSEAGIFAGSVLFNALYSPDKYTEFGWRTGWVGNDNTGLNAGKCSLIFGLIPISWTAGYIQDETYAHEQIVWRNGFMGTGDIATFLQSINVNPSDVKSTELTYNQFNSLSDPVDYHSNWSNQLQQVNVNALQISDERDSWFMLGDLVNPNSYSSVKCVNNVTLCGGAQNDKHYTVENYSREKDSYMPSKNSVAVRFGSIIKKEISGNTTTLAGVPAFGYIKYHANAGTSDTDLIYTYKRNTTTQECAGSTQAYSNAVAQDSNYVNEHYFGSFCPDAEYMGNIQIHFSEILTYIRNKLIQPSLNGLVHNNSTPLVCNTHNMSNVPCYNMFNASTIKYITQITTRTNSHRIIDFVPVFAQSMQNDNFSNGYCCMIHTFQSIVYNTYFNDPFNSTLTNLHPYNIEEGELAASAYSVNNLKNYSQCKNTWSKYNNFVMKYNPDNEKMYLSFAIKINATSNGRISSIGTGPQLASKTDWIAWVNGNIYVIPNSLFESYVYHTDADFDLLDSQGQRYMGTLSS